MSNTVKFNNPVIKWIDKRLPIFSMMVNEYGTFPMPRNINYFWSFGSIASVLLLVMIGTGLLLAIQYQPSTELAFESVERIMREVNWGWLLRYMHSNGASMFFLAIYIHMYRGMYYGSYKNPRELLWILGVLIFFIMIMTAFLGYTLPWGQQSFWAATVITNLFSAIPGIGESVVSWLWGGFSVDQPTLNRFFVLHFLMPFILLALVAIHVWALHISGSNNPTGIEVKPSETIPFYPYVLIKDAVALIAFAIVFSVFIFYMPNILGHPDNYIPANPFVTPEHIVPEWYFLPFYAILRAVPSIGFISAKLAGVIAMLSSILVLIVLPWLDRSPVRSCRYRPIYKWLIMLLAIDVIFLGWLGSKPAEGIYITLARLATIWYFFHFLVILPFIPKFEKIKYLPTSLSKSVTGK